MTEPGSSGLWVPANSFLKSCKQCIFLQKNKQNRWLILNYLRCNVNNSYHSWADPRRLFLVWKPELKINFEANCTVSMASSSASGLSFSLLTYGELAFMIFRMNWKYSCVYWFRWWRNLTFCFWIERSIGAGILIFLFELVPLSLPVDGI